MVSFGIGLKTKFACHEEPEGEQRYSSTLSLTLALDVGGWSTPSTRPFYPLERPGTHCIGVWVGPEPI